MRISDWSSDVCSSDLQGALQPQRSDRHDLARGADVLDPRAEVDLDMGRDAECAGNPLNQRRRNKTPEKRLAVIARQPPDLDMKIGRASCRERVCQYV